MHPFQSVTRQGGRIVDRCCLLPVKCGPSAEIDPALLYVSNNESFAKNLMIALCG